MSRIELLPTCVPRERSDIDMVISNVRDFAPCIHIDIDDGILAPHLTWPYVAEGKFAPFNSLPTGTHIEVHLMVDQPQAIGEAFARAGAHRIIGHLEGFRDIEEARAAYSMWKAAGAQEVVAGVLFDTPLSALAPVAPQCDGLHAMSIATIGTQGIPYEHSAPERIAELHRLFPEKTISVDGGVSKDNISSLVKAGATRFGVGSAIFRAPDPKAAYEELLQLAERALE